MTSNNSICSYDVKNNLREMMAGLYDSDHDFYDQLKKAIYYDGKTYIGVCERLIELIGSGCCHGKVDVNAGREAAADWVDDFRDEVAAMVGVTCDGMVDDVKDAIKAELDKRIMPDGMEWPRFEGGEKITWNNSPDHTAAICLALDGSCYALHYDMPDDERMCIYDVSERVKRPDTQERIYDDATLPPEVYCVYILHIESSEVGDYSECAEAIVTDLLRRQRDLCANGGE